MPCKLRIVSARSRLNRSLALCLMASVHATSCNQIACIDNMHMTSQASAVLTDARVPGIIDNLHAAVSLQVQVVSHLPAHQSSGGSRQEEVSTAVPDRLRLDWPQMMLTRLPWYVGQMHASHLTVTCTLLTESACCKAI